MRIFLDSNVLFSACLLERSRQYAFFALARAGRCQLVTSAYANEETRRNIARKAPVRVAVLATLARLAEVVPDPSVELVAWAASQELAAKDAPILAAAVVARADLLVTGDRRHFPHHYGRAFQGVWVLSLADGLAELLSAK
jgi:predicted nucleic acid-binding protein